jgi:predicted membrane channel-forming protein YqfA (hemolysin III family)
MKKLNLNNIFSINNLKFTDVDPEFCDPFIQTGYRNINSSFLYCIKSVFYVNNETLNFWTHFLPAIYFIYKVNLLIVDPLANNLCFEWPLVVYFSSASFYLLISSFAHMFNCKSSIARHSCFLLDYLSISTYGIGSSIAYSAYTIKIINIKLDTTNKLQYYIFFVMFISILTNLMTCLSRFIISRKKRILLRVASFSAQYLLINLPLFYRFLMRYNLNELLSSLDTIFSFLSNNISNNYSSLNENINFNKNETINIKISQSDKYYIGQCIAAFVSLLFYTTHLPECVCPKVFDIIGQSHQIFHLTAFLCTYLQSKAIENDWSILKNSIHYSVNTNYKFFLYSCFFSNFIIFLIFYFKLKRKNPWKLIQKYS